MVDLRSRSPPFLIFSAAISLAVFHFSTPLVDEDEKAIFAKKQRLFIAFDVAYQHSYNKFLENNFLCI
jgi:hypothetical protein